MLSSQLKDTARSRLPHPASHMSWVLSYYLVYRKTTFFYLNRVVRGYFCQVFIVWYVRREASKACIVGGPRRLLFVFLYRKRSTCFGVQRVLFIRVWHLKQSQVILLLTASIRRLAIGGRPRAHLLPTILNKRKSRLCPAIIILFNFFNFNSNHL